jgi:hypothetical protein
MNENAGLSKMCRYRLSELSGTFMSTELHTREDVPPLWNDLNQKKHFFCFSFGFATAI